MSNPNVIFRDFPKIVVKLVVIVELRLRVPIDDMRPLLRLCFPDRRVRERVLGDLARSKETNLIMKFCMSSHLFCLECFIVI